MLISLELIVAGLVLLVFGGEFLVRGASALAVSARVSPLVIGLTVVAMGTSSPEFAVSLQAAAAGKSDLAVGNVVGSNIFNVLFVLGISALIAPLLVTSQLVRIDVPLMIVASVLVYVLGLDGGLGRLDGALLFGLLVAYTVWSIRESRRKNHAPDTLAEQWSDETEDLPRNIYTQVTLIVGGLVLLSLGSRLLVRGAVEIATLWGVSELIIGLTVIAVGTSLPEVAASVMAAMRGERDIAVGNVVGSNLFNILGVLGLSALVAPGGVPVSAEALEFDIPVMLAVAVATLPIFFTGHLIARWEGGLFFFYYLLYTTYLVLNALGHPFSRHLAQVTVLFVLPLTVVTLLIGVVRAWRSPA